jgi:hypothetical protein
MADIATEKAGVAHDEETNYPSTLSPEELVLEKKLRRRIDSVIMPMVILVYLMNYIDRYWLRRSLKNIS